MEIFHVDYICDVPIPNILDMSLVLVSIVVSCPVYVYESVLLHTLYDIELLNYILFTQ